MAPESSLVQRCDDWPSYAVVIGVVAGTAESLHYDRLRQKTSDACLLIESLDPTLISPHIIRPSE